MRSCDYPSPPPNLSVANPGDEVDTQTSACELVEGGEHFRQKHRVDVAGSSRQQGFDRTGARRQKGPGHIGFPASRNHREENIFKAGRFG